MRALFWIFYLSVAAPLVAQEIPVAVATDELETSAAEAAAAQPESVEEAEVVAVQLEAVSVPVELMNQSWFTDRPGTALIYFDEMVDAPESLPSGATGLSFIDIEVRETPDAKTGKAVAIVRFILRETGTVTFPSINFTTETKRYHSIPQQIIVGAPVRSEAMSVTLSTAKRQVYVGEPLRVELAWHCELEASRLQSLNYYPAFFNDADVEIVIPRSTEPESQQVGLPLGGRRVIARRTLIEGQPKALGTVELPIYLRLNAAGVYTLQATRLEFAYLNQGSRNFGQYAAHFNNSFFAPEEADTKYERFYVETTPIEIEVLPLPVEGRLPEFSGLFAPMSMQVTVTPEAQKVGELMQAELKVFSDAPHGMIELPKLSLERGLHGRFLVDDNLGRTWRADGTTFLARLRTLTTDVRAFPSLHIQTFDPEAGAYVMLVTEPVALSVEPNEGQDFIDLGAYKGAEITLSKKSEGVWHNRKANKMNDLINNIAVLLASWFWLWLVIALCCFLLMLPVVRERRRRALDTKYCARAEAYSAFRKLSENDPAKWPAFLQFLAVSFGADGHAWTVSDSELALQSISASAEDTEAVVSRHNASDAQDYSVQHPAAQIRALNAVGKRVLGLVGQSALLLLLLFSFCATAPKAQASDWSEAEQLFEQALEAQAGSDAAVDLYAESALKFQAAAEAGQRSGIAWYNAGNAWFQTGALGRSIAAYRQAVIYRPFDSMLAENLSEARALALNDVPEASAWWLQLPAAWLKALLLVLIILLGMSVLLSLRYQRRSGWIVACMLLLLCLVTSGLWVISAQVSGQHGVVIVDSVLARKGPGYAYAGAFHEPLYDGVEFTIKETREAWGLVALTDGRFCWLPLSQTQLIR